MLGSVSGAGYRNRQLSFNGFKMKDLKKFLEIKKKFGGHICLADADGKYKNYPEVEIIGIGDKKSYEGLPGKERTYYYQQMLICRKQNTPRKDVTVLLDKKNCCNYKNFIYTNEVNSENLK